MDFDEEIWAPSTGLDFHPVKIDGRIIMGTALGPYFSNGIWTSNPSQWIFSRFKGYIPFSTEIIPDSVLVMSFQSSLVHLSKFGDLSTPSEGTLCSGMRLSFNNDKYSSRCDLH